jgi:Calcineurin-like phosphoesterase
MEQGRIEGGGYQNGRLVDLRAALDKTVYLVGDIHARHSRISAILTHAQLQPQLETEQAVLVFLGDLFHREDDDRAHEMESSLETFSVVMELKIRFPRAVYFLLGNHEFTRTKSTKRGYFQGDLFREALESQGLAECYQSFLKASPLVVIHPRYVGVHAGPAIHLGSLDELRDLPVEDVGPLEMPQALRELAFSRHCDWSGNSAKAYNDYQVRDFLDLCGVPEGRLITGHTPLDRETAWSWDIGKHLTVIFAAGREVGYLRLTADDAELVRVGRGQPKEDRMVTDRAPRPLPSGPGQRPEVIHGRWGVTLDDPTQGIELQPDVCYRFHYPSCRVTLGRPDGESFRICQYRHLSAASQSYYAQGYYLVGNESGQEVLKLKLDLAVLLGGSELVEGVRFRWGEQEFAILRMPEAGVFELMPLVEGLRLG